MKFGICGSLKVAADAKALGWDYLEENCQSLLRGTEPAWTAPDPAVLPVPAVNAMVPGSLKIVGPDARHEPLLEYMSRVLPRARQVGISRVVFGSGVARFVPEGWSRESAVSQITAFLTSIAPIAQANEVKIVIEPLNRGECNIINTVAEAMTYVRKVDHPNIRCLVDSYHLWLEDEPLKNIEEAMPWIDHVHVADKEGRVAPNLSGKSDYKSFFSVLKRGGYDQRISVESAAFDLNTVGPGVLKFLQETWNAA